MFVHCIERVEFFVKICVSINDCNDSYSLCLVTWPLFASQLFSSSDRQRWPLLFLDNARYVYQRKSGQHFTIPRKEVQYDVNSSFLMRCSY